MWSRNGRELFFREGTRMMSVAVAPGAVFSAGRPTHLFDAPAATDGNTDYDVAPDGRFLMIDREARVTGQLILVQHWFEELKAKAGVGQR